MRPKKPKLTEEERAEAAAQGLDLTADILARIFHKQIAGLLETLDAGDLGDRIRISLHADPEAREAMQRLRDLLREMLEEWGT
jgi:hypothetical protein